MSSTFLIKQADAVAFLRIVPNDSVDLIITDPPYESLEKYRAEGTTTRLKHSSQSSNDWFDIFPNKRFAELMPELYRVLKPNRHAYIFCDSETMFSLVPDAVSSGFKFHKPLVWDKVSIGMGYHYRARYEFILFFEKGKRKLTDLGIADVLSFKRLKGKKYYPTEKPVELLKVLLRQSTSRNELVIDPFMGSGSTGVAALELGRRFAGNDISQSAVDVATTRLRGLAIE